MKIVLKLDTTEKKVCSPRTMIVSQLQPGEFFTLKKGSPFIVGLKITPHSYYCVVIGTENYPYTEAEKGQKRCIFDEGNHIPGTSEVAEILGKLVIAIEPDEASVSTSVSQPEVSAAAVLPHARGKMSPAEKALNQWMVYNANNR